MLGICPHHISFAGISGDFCELRPAVDEYEGNGPNGSLAGDMAGVASPLPGCFPPKKKTTRGARRRLRLLTPSSFPRLYIS